MRRNLLAGAALAALLIPAWGCAEKTSAPVTCDNAGIHLLAFSSDRRQAAGHYQIWLYDLDEQGFRLLRNLASVAGIDSSPAISPDGQLVAFVRTDSADLSRVRTLLYDRASCGFISRPALDTGHERDPAFTGDALRLAFARDTLGHWRIRMLNAAGSLAGVGSLADPRAWDDWAPSPNQDGSLIAFVSNRNGSEDVFVYNVATDSLLDLPDLRSADREIEPSLTPGGRWLAFASDRAGGSGGLDVYLYDLSTRSFAILPNLNSPEDDCAPSIRPDGALLAFESGRAGGGGNRDLWIYSVALGNAPSQGSELGSAGDDIHPSVMWP